jgi:hypothetical protein
MKEIKFKYNIKLKIFTIIMLVFGVFRVRSSTQLFDEIPQDARFGLEFELIESEFKNLIHLYDMDQFKINFINQNGEDTLLTVLGKKYFDDFLSREELVETLPITIREILLVGLAPMPEMALEFLDEKGERAQANHKAINFILPNEQTRKNTVSNNGSQSLDSVVTPRILLISDVNKQSKQVEPNLKTIIAVPKNTGKNYENYQLQADNAQLKIEQEQRLKIIQERWKNLDTLTKFRAVSWEALTGSEKTKLLFKLVMEKKIYEEKAYLNLETSQKLPLKELDPKKLI